MTHAAKGTRRTPRALVVDDEAALAGVVASYLVREAFEVDVAHDGASALTMARATNPDVVILDVGLPGVDGLEVCRRLRTFSDAYVIMLTARDTELDTVVGLSVGADDYVGKPFSPRELVARVRAMQRRPRGGQTTNDAAPTGARRFGTLSIDVGSRQIWRDDKTVALTKTEFDILAALCAQPGMVLSRRQLLDSVWGQAWVGSDNVVDVHVGHLRRKIGDDPATPQCVITVRGVGYRLRVPS